MFICSIVNGLFIEGGVSVKFKVYSKLRRLFLLTALVILMAGSVPASAVPYDVNLVTAIQDVAKKAIPSVVHIEVTEKQSVVNPLLPFQNDPFFQYFFGNSGKWIRGAFLSPLSAIPTKLT